MSEDVVTLDTCAITTMHGPCYRVAFTAFDGQKVDIPVYWDLWDRMCNRNPDHLAQMYDAVQTFHSAGYTDVDCAHRLKAACMAYRCQAMMLAQRIETAGDAYSICALGPITKMGNMTVQAMWRSPYAIEASAAIRLCQYIDQVMFQQPLALTGPIHLQTIDDRLRPIVLKPPFPLELLDDPWGRILAFDDRLKEQLVLFHTRS